MSTFLSVLGTIAFLASVVYFFKGLINRFRKKESKGNLKKTIIAFVASMVLTITGSALSNTDDTASDDSTVETKEESTDSVEKEEPKKEKTVEVKESEILTDAEMKIFIGTDLHQAYEAVNDEFQSLNLAVQTNDMEGIANVVVNAPQDIRTLKDVVTEYRLENQDRLSTQQEKFLDDVYNFADSFDSSINNLHKGLSNGNSEYIELATQDIKDVNIYVQSMQDYMEKIK